MSDKNEYEEAHKNSADKKIGKRLKDEPSVEKTDTSNISEELGKNVCLNDFEECSGKNPKLTKDLKELFDKFGQESTNSQINKSPVGTAKTLGTTKKDITESNSERCVENIVSVEDFSRANNKESSETTLDGKFVRISDSSNCHEIKCTCCQTDQNITDIEESQICFNTNELPSHNISMFPTRNRGYLSGECCNHEDPQINRTNRYNFNQFEIRHHPKERTRLHKFFPRRHKTNKSNVSKNDSGETIPQLYKANVKHLNNYGLVPEKFTFKAVTGNLPGILEYNHHPCNCPCIAMTRQRVNFEDDYLMGTKETKQDERRKGGIGFFKHLKKNKSKDYEKIKSSTHKLQHGSNIHGHRTKKNKSEIHDNKNVFFNQVCLPFEENEYVSNKQLPDRIDIYCFDHLNTSYFRTCDQPPPLITDIAMEKTEEVATRFWAEIFGFIHVIIAFFVAFILQFYKFLLYSIVRPIMVGLVQLTSDYFFKPLLTITYNGFTQPFLVFLFNVAASFRDLCLPIAKGLGYFVSEIAVLLRAIRLVDCGKNTSYRQMKDSCC